MNLKETPDQPASVSVESATDSPQRILVVEDDSEVRLLNARVLSHSGYLVDAVEDGAAGWNALNTNRYDLLITDNDMPKVSGTELIKKVRSARMALPIILASGVIPEEEPELQLAAMLQKPFTVETLLEAVREVLRAAARSFEPMESKPPESYQL